MDFKEHIHSATLFVHWIHVAVFLFRNDPCFETIIQHCENLLLSSFECFIINFTIKINFDDNDDDNDARWTYSASKGAVNILTKNMALDLAKLKIRVNSVSPAWIWSPEVSKVRMMLREEDVIIIISRVMITIGCQGRQG